MKSRKQLRALLSLVLVLCLLSAWGPAALAAGDSPVSADDGGGDIAVTAEGIAITLPCDEAVAQALSSAAEASANNGCTVTVHVEDGLTLTITPGGDSTAYVNGARAFGSGPSSEAGIDVAGDLTVSNSAGAALGASAVSTVEGVAEIDIHGDVSVSSSSSSATGVEAYIKGGEEAGTSSAITVEGSVSASGATRDTTAIDAEVNNGTASITVGGNAEAVGGESAVGASLRVFGSSSADLNVGGSLSAEGSFLINGLIVYASGDVQASAQMGGVRAENTGGQDGPAFASGVITQAFGGADVTVSVGSDGVSATGPADCELVGLELVTGDGGSVRFATDGDVYSDGCGLLTSAYSEGDVAMDVLIEGTLSGGEQALRIERGSADGLTLTVWKTSIGENGMVAAAGESAEPGAAESAEAGILYIIKLEQPAEGGSVALDGVGDSHGFAVAREGDTVTLKVTTEDGYVLKAAYNNDEALSLQDADGSYYLLVPKGGGVVLSVELGAAESEDPAPGEEPAPSEALTADAGAQTTGITNIPPANAGVYVAVEPELDGPRLIESAVYAGLGQIAQLDFFDDGSCLVSFPDGSAFEGRFEIVDGVLFFSGIEITVTADEEGMLHCVFVRGDGLEVEFLLSPEFIAALSAALVA